MICRGAEFRPPTRRSGVVGTCTGRSPRPVGSQVVRSLLPSQELRIEAVDKLAWLDAEAVRQSEDRRQLWLSATPLQATDRGRVNVGLASEAVL